MFKKFKISISILIIVFKLNAQDTILLRTLEINDTRKTTQKEIYKLQNVDSLTKQAFDNLTLADLLTQKSQLFVKKYGPGSLATTAFRGAAAVHTAILWNGININSSMNGSLDLSLLPVFLSDEIAIQYGGTTALWGNGAVAGSIQLNNNLKFNKGFTSSLGANFGSFNTYTQFGKVNYSSSKLSTSVKFTNTHSQNNFIYLSPYSKSNETERQVHADYKQQNFMFENAIKFSDKTFHTINLWYQQGNRKLPPVLFQPNYGSIQDDVNTRLISELKHFSRASKWMLRNAFLDEQILFYDHLADKKYTNRALSSINEIEHSYKFSKLLESTNGVNYTYQTAYSGGYTNNPFINRLAFFSSWNLFLFNNNLMINSSFRKEWMLKQQIPITYTLASTLKINEQISFKTNTSKLYRLPTFNDLFWTPGGNINLNPEDGFSHEISGIIFLNDNSSGTFLKHTSTLFTRRIKNWIIWLPQGSYWAPQNLLDAWSRGLETQSEIGFKINPLLFMLQLSTSYVVSTPMKAIYDGDNSVNKQLIYVPMYSGQGNFKINYHSFNFNYNITYTGYRYTSTDNSAFLPPFWLNNVWLAKAFDIKKCKLEISARVNNIFNESYQVMLNRPMPLRNYQIGIRIDFY